MKTKKETLEKYGFIKGRKKVEYSRIYHKDLDDCYGRYSQAKKHAYEYCIKLANELDSDEYGILSYNVNEFTFGFYFKDDNGILCYAYITKTYNRYYEVEQ